MKIKYSLLFSTLIVLSSCVKDSYDDCQKLTWISLSHEYYADVKENVLNRHLDLSSVYIYDASDKLVEKVDVNRDELIFGSHLTALPGGRYTLISWANMGSNTSTEFVSQRATARLNTINSLGEGNYHTSDKLYYAKKEIIVAENEGYRPKQMAEVLRYESAHINFKVIVRGKKGTDIEASFKNFMPTYDFEKEALRPYETTYTPLLIEETLEEGGYKRLMEFSSFRFRNDNRISIELRDKSTQELLLPAISLSELMNKNGVTVEDKHEVNLLIELSIESGKLNASIKEWSEEEVIPEN